MEISNKRGVFLTSIAIIVLTVFLISFSIVSKYQERKLIERRIGTMNSYLFSLEEDLSRKLYIAGFRIIFLFEKDIIETGTYLTDVQTSFDEAFFQSRINGKTNSEIELLMIGTNYTEIKQSILTKADELNLEIEIYNPQVQISQEDPWNIKITFTSLLELKDKSNLASWNRTQSISSKIPIIGLEDPTYPIEGNDISISNLIIRTPFEPIAPNIGTHAQESYYHNSTEAPSFLDRLEGDLISQSPYGIESFAVPKLSVKNGVNIIDHEYFLDNQGTSQVSGQPSWFLLDAQHCATYNLVCN